ncbi:MAG: T9SS type A sorting domain-containing protein [Ignavibacteria bacterium]|nr:T9SS type A sorting domain-containing protein [Ignavibacteria bacterium]
MKQHFFFITLLLGLLFFTSNYSTAQQMNGTWSCKYATWDAGDGRNSIGYNTASVGVLKEDHFVALAANISGTTAYLVGYENATDSTGMIGSFPYNQTGLIIDWINPDNGFDFLSVKKPMKIIVTPDSLIYLANNDELKNVLVFKLTGDTTLSTIYRMETGTSEIHDVKVDANGYVYVSEYAANGLVANIKVFNGINNDVQWGDLHNSSPILTFALPDTGRALGLAVSNNGSLLYVANYTLGKIYLYTGGPTTGYTLYSGFNYTNRDTAIGGSFSGPTGLALLEPNNLLFVSQDVFGVSTYDFGKVNIVHGFSGETLSTCDIAAWNFLMTGTYNNRPNGGMFPNASGYASTLDVDVDALGNMYAVSYNGWTVDKFQYSETLPIIPNPLGIEKSNNSLPTEFNLTQNFPNPFNPITTIEFSITDKSFISLNIYSITGQLVETVVSQTELDRGNYKYTFDASKLASGTYIYTLTNGTNTISKKMTLIK